MVLRAVAVIWGFSLLAAPHRPAPDSEALDTQPISKAFGAILILAAFFPFGETPSKTRVVGTTSEDL